MPFRIFIVKNFDFLLMPIQKLTDSHQLIMPYLMVAEAERLITFLQSAFDAKEKDLEKRDDGDIMHAEYAVDSHALMVAQSNNDCAAAKANLFIYVKDDDKAYRKALQAGGTSTMEPLDQHWGSRMCGIADPVGNVWWLTAMK